MPKAKKLPSGSWRCQATFEGERESFTADTKREAEYLALQWQTGRRDLKHKGITVQDAAEQYIKARNAVLSPKTIREQKSMLKYFPPEISGMYISKIDTEIVQAWVNTMSQTKAPKTVRNHYGFFSAVVHSLDPDLRLNIKLPQKVKTTIYIPTHEEVAHLLGIYEKTDGEMFTATQLASAMGLRRGEVCALPNNKRDFKIRKVDIHQAFVQDEKNNIVLKTTKTYDSNRILTAPQYIADNLMDIPKDWDYAVKTNPNNITNRFNRTIKREFDTPFSFHDLRHYYASVLIAEGVPERYAMYLLGHSTPNMIRNVYGHIMADKEDEISRNINAVFSDRFSCTQKRTQTH